MILPPFSAPEDFQGGLHPPENGKQVWFLFLGNQLLVSKDQKRLPTSPTLPLKRHLYFGSLNERHFFAGEIEGEPKAPKGWKWQNLISLHTLLNDNDYALAGRALQLIQWDRSHQFCGLCGKTTHLLTDERCRKCDACGHLAYPKIAPAVMALVKRGKKILLARSPHFPGKFYSVLAGFIEPGETLEQCVSREIEEEVGIKVQNIRYFASQPWPFSYSLMIGFICDWKEGEIMIDPKEIESADWFDAKNLPEVPKNLSLASMLIEAHIRCTK